MLAVVSAGTGGSAAAGAQQTVPLERPEPTGTVTTPTQGETGSELDPRSHELLDHDCRSEVGRRRVTLFGNGTVRLWDGLIEDQRMTLGELTPDEVTGYLEHLRGIDLSEVPRAPAAPSAEGGGVAARLRATAAVRNQGARSATGGEWVEECAVTLHLDLARPPARYRYGRYDSLALGVMTLVRIAEELAGRALPASDLPVGYVAQRGDVLRRADGSLFEIVGETDDGQGLELHGLEQPLTIYVRRDGLRAVFVGLVPRRPGRR